jgi:hypothetical protein
MKLNRIKFEMRKGIKSESEMLYDKHFKKVSFL